MAPHTRPSNATRLRIIQAALDCFGRKGYNSTTMDEIAAESGTSKGTLYWHFESKDDLLASAFRWFFETNFRPEALTILETTPNAADRLRILADAMVDVTRKAEGLFNLFLESWASSANREKAADLWLGLLVQYQEVVVDIIDTGVERGEFRPVDAEALTWALMAAYDGLAAYVMLQPDLNLLRIHTTFIESLLRGLEADA